MTVPPEAITADPNPYTTQAMRRAFEHGREVGRAEMPTGVIHLKGGQLNQAELDDLAAKWRAAYERDKNKPLQVLPDDTDERITEAVAAERERCARLAETHAAVWRDPDAKDTAGRRGAYVPFAGILRRGAP